MEAHLVMAQSPTMTWVALACHSEEVAVIMANQLNAKPEEESTFYWAAGYELQTPLDPQPWYNSENEARNAGRFSQEYKFKPREWFEQDESAYGKMTPTEEMLPLDPKPWCWTEAGKVIHRQATWEEDHEEFLPRKKYSQVEEHYNTPGWRR